MAISANVQEYIDYVRSGTVAVCKDQIALVDHVERCFDTEELYVDEDQLRRYLNFQRYFPFNLFLWERFVFTLHNCTYRKDGSLRWPFLFLFVGRGTGKNAYEAFEDFCLLTPVNGVKHYDIDIFANSEDQATRSFDDVYNVLEDNKAELQRYFHWNKEVITNLKTGSKLCFHTSNFKTKDGARPGKVCIDEIHQYENYKLINTAFTGLGKVSRPRRTIMSTNGYVRGGPLDDYLTIAEDVLFHGMDDSGILFFICRLDSYEEIDDPKNWVKANPSLPYLPDLFDEIMMEYQTEYKHNPSAAADFVVKRMNLYKANEECNVTEWENILAANKPLPDFDGCPCVPGIDYMKTTDFLAAGLLFKKDDVYYWMSHSWVCRQSADLPRIKAPLYEWEAKGLLTFVDGPEIPPELVADWLEAQAKKYRVTVIGLDNFRYTLLAKALKEKGFDTDKGGANNIRLLKRVTQMRWVPVITSLFNNQKIIWGENPLMNWYTNNTMIITERGNQYYGKKEAKSRKTDGFMALVAAICASEDLEDCTMSGTYFPPAVYSY